MINTRHLPRAFLILMMLALAVGVFRGPLLAQEQGGATKPGESNRNGPVVRDLPSNIPGHIGFLDNKNGFRGVAFGTSVSDFKNLSLYRDRGVVKAYRRADEDLSVGAASVESIVYVFVHDKFYAVSIHVDSENSKNLLKLFQVAFGQGIRPPGPASQYFWTGKVASAHFFEDVDPGSHEGRGWIGNNELQKDYDEAMKEFFMEAAGKL
jgi:hypothetical protein